MDNGKIEAKEEEKGNLISILAEAKNLCRFYEIVIPKYFKGFKLAFLWNLWELMITETGLLVIANSPEEASFVIGILTSLIYPLKFIGHYHPYTTLNDPAITTYSSTYNGKAWPFLLLGTCNPYLAKVK